MKKVLGIYSAPRPHWVGDGFPVRTLFDYGSHGAHLSPFLLLDYAGPAHFTQTDRQRGVGQHPHRGFETVTIVYQGEVEHRDSTGAGGLIGPGDVQWMTAANGILHEEFHSPAFSKAGGTLEMVQLWVNLPASGKRAEPGYQTLLDAQIPTVDLPDGAGAVRVIAGTFDGHTGPARTFTPMQVWDVKMNQGHLARFESLPGHTFALVVLHGSLLINGTHAIQSGQLAQFERGGHDIELEASSDAVFLLLGGEPIDEPIVGHGPFVMNSQAEIAQAIDDFNHGRFGQLPR